MATGLPPDVEPQAAVTVHRIAAATHGRFLVAPAGRFLAELL